MERHIKKITDRVAQSPMAGAVLAIWRRCESYDIVGMAARTAYWLLISFFPLILLMLSITAGLQLDLFEDIIPLTVLDMLEDMMGSTPKAELGTLSSLVLVWSASTSIRAMMDGIYVVHTGRRHGQVKGGRLRAIAFTIVLTIFVYLCVSTTLISGLFLDWVSSHFDRMNERFIYAGRMILITCLMFLFNISLYSAIPGDGMRMRDTLAGSAAASLGWVAATWGFEMYMKLFNNYSVLYGGVGAFLGLALWLYIIAMILFAGAEVNTILFKRKEEKTQVRN